MSAPQIRLFEEDDLPEVLAVLSASLGESPLLARTPELWHWKHRDNPFGPSIVLLATVDGSIGGIRALMRWDLVDEGGRLIRCVRAVDTATHPDFQRRGIFRSLTLAAIDEATAQGIDLIFNTPNERSGAGYLTMGWREVGPIGVMVRPTIRSLRRPPQPHPADWWGEVDGVDAPAVITPTPDRPGQGLRTPRSTDYLEWRYRGHPTARYVTATIGASSVVARPNLRSGRRELVISDLLGPQPAKPLRWILRHNPGDYAVGWFSPGTLERKVASRAGLAPVPRVTALTLFARSLNGLEDVFDLSRWDLSIGDLELL